MVQRPRSPLIGMSWLLGVAGASAGCCAIGLLCGMFEAGLVPGVAGWLSGGWTVPLATALSSAGIGGLAAALMTRSALRQVTTDSEIHQPVGGDAVAAPGVDSYGGNQLRPTGSRGINAPKSEKKFHPGVAPHSKHGSEALSHKP